MKVADLKAGLQKYVESRTPRRPQNADQKLWYVPWEGHAYDQDERGLLNNLCLQGPHDWDTAHKIAAEVRGAGFRASVIDCSRTLKWAALGPEAIEVLEMLVASPKYARDGVATMSTREVIEAARAVLAKATALE